MLRAGVNLHQDLYRVLFVVVSRTDVADAGSTGQGGNSRGVGSPGANCSDVSDDSTVAALRLRSR